MPINRCSAAFIISRPYRAAVISALGCRLGVTHNDFPTVWQNLASRPDGPDVEPAEISWLRDYSNYLTPKIGHRLRRHLDGCCDLSAQSDPELAGDRSGGHRGVAGAESCIIDALGRRCTHPGFTGGLHLSQR